MLNTRLALLAKRKFPFLELSPLCTIGRTSSSRPLPRRVLQTQPKPMARDPSKVPKLADVARAAKVGNATVSRALSGGKNVSSDAMKRISDAVLELGYQPNRVAQTLKGASSGIVGMIVRNDEPCPILRLLVPLPGSRFTHSSRCRPDSCQSPSCVRPRLLALTTLEGTRLAIGDHTQVLHGDHVTSRLTLRFRHGSIDDDTTVFTHRVRDLVCCLGRV